MKTQRTLILLLAVLFCSGAAVTSLGSEPLGQFDKERDLYIAHFDLKTDVDDVHSVAAVATMLAHPDFKGVTYHAVAGAYGAQGGLYVPANDLFDMAFGANWSDAHDDFDKAVKEVSDKANDVFHAGGYVWIAEGGQSDFSAALVRNLEERFADAEIKDYINIVQHSDWNEEVTTAEDLVYVKQAATYHKIPDGNAPNNGTPDFRDDRPVHWKKYVKDERLIAIWNKAIAIANKYNGVEGRYLNKSIKKGGLDFSDTAETTWIFGFSNLKNADEFFKKFTMKKPKAAK